MHTKKTNNINKLIQISYHSILTKIQELQNLKKKKKKKNFFLYRPVLPEIDRYGWYGRYGRYFFGTKQGSRTYRIAGRYNIFRPYRPIRYGIDNLVEPRHQFIPKKILSNPLCHRRTKILSNPSRHGPIQGILGIKTRTSISKKINNK